MLAGPSRPGAVVINFVAAVTAHTPAPEASVQELARVMEQQRPMLRAFLRKRLDSQEDADDALQETYLRLIRYHGRASVESPVLLLYHVAENVVCDTLRRAQTHCLDAHASLEQVEHQLPADQLSPERILLADQQLQQVMAALGRLSPRCRQVFLLSRLHGMNYPQIAQRCGISVKMVEKHISHALLRLRERVGGWGGAAP